jgi:hypothetical protein
VEALSYCDTLGFGLKLLLFMLGGPLCKDSSSAQDYGWVERSILYNRAFLLG